MLLSAIAIVAFSVLPYLTASLDELAGQKRGLAAAYAGQPLAVRAAFYVHIVLGGLALVLGPLQFSARLRRRRRRLHRAIGRTYLVAVAVAGVMSLVLAPFNTAGMVGFFGFGTLGVLWLWTGRRAYRAIRSGDVPGHQAWMIRNYALTYAAVTLRVLFALLIVVQLPFATGHRGVGAGRDDERLLRGPVHELADQPRGRRVADPPPGPAVVPPR